MVWFILYHIGVIPENIIKQFLIQSGNKNIYMNDIKDLLISRISDIKVLLQQ